MTGSIGHSVTFVWTFSGAVDTVTWSIKEAGLDAYTNGYTNGLYKWLPDDPNHETIVDFVHLFLVGMYPNERAQKRECTF